ncbi:hypothetical protein [Stenotrophomonas maltophilia]|uniref:hypothetical protein n=1 Tax=Stenotrophomonas maltophilia TaxID=40324 RepID=UPI0013DC11FA|nr:hypothetical protein [Stenotrophomonas maltophilia]
MRYAAALILAQDEWDITCPIGEYRSAQEAQQALHSAEASFEEHEGTACLRVAIGRQTLLVTNEEVTITELSAAARARLGSPLDMREPGNANIAITALHNQDPAYRVAAADYVPSRNTLRDLLERYGEGYKPDHVANKIVLVIMPSAN